MYQILRRADVSFKFSEKNGGAQLCSANSDYSLCSGLESTPYDLYIYHEFELVNNGKRDSSLSNTVFFKTESKIHKLYLRMHRSLEF